MIVTGLILNGNIHYSCGNCHAYIGSDDTALEWKDWNYCPHCGEPLYTEIDNRKGY